jgi:acylphosphatase
MPTVEVEVRGRVQGVGFRYFTKGLADRLGVAGEVWNRRDGGVGILAGHPDEAVLAQFVEGLRNGPGRVDHVTQTPTPLTVLRPFSIGITR